MKKLIALFLILALLLPAAAGSAEYTSALGMTMNDFILKYNAIQAPLGSPYVLLDEQKPEAWTAFDGYNCAWYYPEKTKTVLIILMSKDPSGKSTSAGLDMIQIFVFTADGLVPAISTTIRCSTIFSYDLFGTSMASLCVGDVIQYYYENTAKEKGISAYRQLDADGNYVISMFYSDGYCFQISTPDVVI